MSDPDRLAALHGACFTTHPAPWTARAFRDLLADPHGFLIEAPGALLAGRTVAGEAELLTLATAPDARRRGLARALLAGFDAEAAARGAAAAFLEVAEDNAAARALYAAAGWAQVGRRPRYYGPTAALILRKDLPRRDRPLRHG